MAKDSDSELIAWHLQAKKTVEAQQRLEALINQPDKPDPEAQGWGAYGAELINAGRELVNAIKDLSSSSCAIMPSVLSIHPGDAEHIAEWAPVSIGLQATWEELDEEHNALQKEHVAALNTAERLRHRLVDVQQAQRGLKELAEALVRMGRAPELDRTRDSKGTEDNFIPF